MPNLYGSPIWYELMTTEPRAARRFYESVVGWRIPEDANPMPGGPEYREISAPDGMVGGVFTLTDAMCKEGARPCWMAYFSVDDVDKTVASMVADGGSALMPAFDIPNVGRIAMVADPQGAAFYVMRPISVEDRESTAFAPGKLGHFGWNELHAADAPKAFDFYAKHFGWTRSRAMDMGPGAGVYQLFAHGGQDIGGMMTNPQIPRPAWAYYARVASITAAVGRITEGGGRVIQGPMEVPGGDWVVNAMDPQGAMLSLVGPKG